MAILVESLEDRQLLTSFLGGLQPYAQQVVSTVPSSGDVDPYGVAVVPTGFPTGGKLAAGDVLVSNFNDNENLQGTGSSIVAVTPSGQTSTFFQGSPSLGLDGGLAVLTGGYVLVARVPTADGTAATVQQGSLMVLNDNGQVVLNLTSSTYLDGPWGLAVDDLGSTADVFVSNVLNGTVTRIVLSVSSVSVTVDSMTQIASGYSHRLDPAALSSDRRASRSTRPVAPFTSPRPPTTRSSPSPTPPRHPASPARVRSSKAIRLTCTGQPGWCSHPTAT